MGQETDEFFGRNKKTIGAITTGLGGLAKAAGQFGEGRAAKSQAAFEASILRQNRDALNLAADQTIEEGKQVSQVKQIEVANLIGEQRASLAGRNIVVDQDSALDLLVDASDIGRRDEEAIKTSANREALALRMQAGAVEVQAQLAIMRGADAQRVGIAQAARTVLDTAGKVAKKWIPKTTEKSFTRIQIIQEDSEDEA